MKVKPASAKENKKTLVRARARRAVVEMRETVSDRETVLPKSKETTIKPRKTSVRRKKIEPPSILLEGDQPSTPSISGPGEKFALGPKPPAQNLETENGHLPEAYGTKKFFLTARDPHWLYAHWDLTREQQSKLNARSSDGHLVLRIYVHKIEGHPLYEIHVHPESNHWFAHVERAGNSYAAELGFYSTLGKWTRVAVSAATVTPPEAVSAETDAEFATIPFELPFARLIEIIKAAVRENLPLAQAVEELRRAGHPELPHVNGSPIAWTPDQERALAGIINVDEVRRVWMGSLEITELIRRRLVNEMSSLAASQFGQTTSITSLSSPFGAVEKQKGFWFNVNAELIIYGATEPTAKVTLNGRTIKLRPDGSFSFRFALPDGEYNLPAVAVSADGADARAADLKFSRKTEYLGSVGAHPQDPDLKTPKGENL